MFRKGYNIYLDCSSQPPLAPSRLVDNSPVHFSNYWADPSKQAIPPTWPTAVAPLTQTLRNYVSTTLQTFKAAGVDLAIVSLGNEIRHGMLWPTGYVDVDTVGAAARARNYTDLATLWAGARQGVTDAVRAGVKKPQVMIHIDNGWNVTLQQAWFGALTATGKVRTEDW
jgi:arabinogalactan endo-1,4-beta-galactosidase